MRKALEWKISVYIEAVQGVMDLFGFASSIGDILKIVIENKKLFVDTMTFNNKAIAASQLSEYIDTLEKAIAKNGRKHK